MNEHEQLPPPAPRDTPSGLISDAYTDLRGAAQRLLAGEAPGNTLQATALVHEAYLRVTKHNGGANWEGKAHFVAAIVESMRRILVESARSKKRLKRGGELDRRPLEMDRLADPDGDPDSLLSVDEALTALASVNSKWAELVKLRCFLGLTIPEAARALDTSPRTADAWWAAAREWLRKWWHLDIGIAPQ